MKKTFPHYLEAVAALYAGVGERLVMSPPAPKKTLLALEAELGSAVPTDLRLAWETANGGPAYRPVFARPRFITGFDFLSVADARAARDGLRKRAPKYKNYVEPTPRDRRVQPGWFQPGWLPFAGFGEGTLLLMIDGEPSEKGRAGQIIAFTHDPDEISFVAPSFRELLVLSLGAMTAQTEELLLS